MLRRAFLTAILLTATAGLSAPMFAGEGHDHGKAAKCKCPECKECASCKAGKCSECTKDCCKPKADKPAAE